MAVKQYEIEGQLYNVSEAREADFLNDFKDKKATLVNGEQAVSYTHLRAHET